MFWKKRRKRIKAIELTGATFDQALTENKLSFVFFEAPWCGACKILHPIVNELADENREEQILIATVNTDHERELSQRHNIRSLPTLIVRDGGEVLYQGSGMISKPRLQEMIDKLLDKAT